MRLVHHPYFPAAASPQKVSRGLGSGLQLRCIVQHVFYEDVVFLLREGIPRGGEKTAGLDRHRAFGYRRRRPRQERRPSVSRPLSRTESDLSSTPKTHKDGSGLRSQCCPLNSTPHTCIIRVHVIYTRISI